MAEGEIPAEQSSAQGAGGSGAMSAPWSSRPAGEQFAQTFTTFSAFWAPVNARKGTSGVVGNAVRRRRRATGKLDTTDVEPALRFYIPPVSYDEALRALLADHVVILEGERGSGRASGAIALLREVTDRTLLVLPPFITIKQLAKRTYDAAFAYILIDRADEGSAT